MYANSTPSLREPATFSIVATRITLESSTLRGRGSEQSVQQMITYLKTIVINGRQWFRNRGHLRILIAGAPKTGNMWLRMLLWNMYDLRQVDVSGILRLEEYPRQGSFVTHQHLLPSPQLFAWGDALGVHYVTMLRHPGDILLSLYHYVNNMAQVWKEQGRRMGEAPSHSLIGQPLDSKGVRDYVSDHFGDECLQKSVAWIRSNRAAIVRYEDLHQAPEDTLFRLAKALQPVSRGRIHAAIEACSIGKLQAMAGKQMRAHYRKGRTGDWQAELPESITDLLQERYTDELRSMGYDFERIGCRT